jgi:uncharacterized protein (TIGR03437 family)
VTNGNGTSDSYPIYINQLQPGFLAPGSFIVGGKQYVAALFSDNVTFAIPQNAIQGVPSRAAHIGETVTIYGIGFGPVTPAFTAGTIVTDLNTVTNPLQISFGTTQATTTYQGLAPGFVGLYQFNVVVPKVAPNNLTPISFILGGMKAAQTLYIAVQN